MTFTGEPLGIAGYVYGNGYVKHITFFNLGLSSLFTAQQLIVRVTRRQATKSVVNLILVAHEH